MRIFMKPVQPQTWTYGIKIKRTALVTVQKVMGSLDDFDKVDEDFDILRVITDVSDDDIGRWVGPVILVMKKR